MKNANEYVKEQIFELRRNVRLYSTNSRLDQLSVALIAQLVKHWTGIVEIRSANLVQAYFFKKISSVTQIILPDFVLFWL